MTTQIPFIAPLPVYVPMPGHHAGTKLHSSVWLSKGITYLISCQSQDHGDNNVLFKALNHCQIVTTYLN